MKSVSAAVAAATILLVVVGCAAPGVGLPPAVAGAEAPERLEQVSDVLWIEDRREDGDGGLFVHLRAADPVVRRFAARAVGRLGFDEHRESLHDLLLDPDSATAATAATSLGRLPEDPLTTLRLAEILEQEVARESVAASAAAALGRIGSEEAASRLDRWLAGTEPGPSARPGIVQSALLALWRFERDVDPGLVRRWLAVPDDELRWAAVYSLVRRPVPGAANDLLGLTADPDPRVRALVARYLTRQTTERVGLEREARTALAVLARDAEPNVRVFALGAIASHRSPGDEAHLSGATRAAEVHVRSAAVEALGIWGQPSAARLLTERLDDPEEHPAIRRRSLELLARIDPEAAAGRIRSFAESAAWRDRAAAVAALMESDELETAASVADHRDARVVSAFLRNLPSTDEGRARFHRIGEDALRSDAPGVVSAAAAAYAIAPDASGVAALVEAFEWAHAMGEPSVMLALVDAFAAHVDAGFTTPDPLLSLPAPSQSIVRSRAIERLGASAIDHWGDRTPVDVRLNWDDVRRAAARALRSPGAPRERVAIDTEHGRVVIELAAEAAPLTVDNFLRLTDLRFYDDQEWPRVIPGFVAQGGDPGGDTSGGPGYTIRDEINRIRYTRGVVGMAHAGPNTAGSQFFATFFPQPHLDGDYTVFGWVVEGMDILERTLPGDRIHRIRREP